MQRSSSSPTPNNNAESHGHPNMLMPVMLHSTPISPLSWLQQENVQLHHQLAWLQQECSRLYATLNNSDLPQHVQWRLSEENRELEDTKQRLQNDIHAFTEQLESLHQEFVLLPQITAVNIDSEKPFSTHRKMGISRPISFNEIVLRMLAENTPQELSILQGKLNDTDNRAVYFQQFLPYILEEIRVSVEKEIEAIKKKSLSAFQVTYHDDSNQPEMIDSILLRIRVSLPNKDLPKLDHGFYQELIMIKVPQKANKKQNEKLSFIFAIAKADRHTEDDADEEDIKEKRIDLEITLSQQDLGLLHSDMKAGDVTLDLHRLCGLIPAERMYQACSQMHRTSFERQFLRAELPAWQKNVEEISVEPHLHHLNSSQQDIIQQLKPVLVEPRLSLIQGPPGTGKTNTAAATVVELLKCYPEKRILVCTPSNQALRELLMRISALSPSAYMALIGVGKKLSPELSHVYVHQYANNLYQPLIDLKKQLRASERIFSYAEEIQQQSDRILGEILLLTCELTMPIKPNVLRQIYLLQNSIETPCKELIACTKNNENKEDILEKIEDIIQTLKQNAYRLEEFLVQRAQVVFATLVASGRPWLNKQIAKFDIVILDEAAQALIPEVLIPMKFFPDSFIQFGDPQQLPPTVTSPRAQENGYANSMMYRLMLDYEQPYQMLTLQYRMHPAICAWISSQFYSNRLETADSVLARTSILESNQQLHRGFKKPCLFFNIHGQEDKSGKELSASTSNAVEASAIVKMACYLIFTCGIKPENIGIITFYAAQVALIKNLFTQSLKDKKIAQQQQKQLQKELLIHTVDGFQGGEKKITLVSMVRTSESVGFLNDERRLNVGMSRAQEARWVFGFFETLNQSNSVLPSLLEKYDLSDVVSENSFNTLLNTRMSGTM